MRKTISILLGLAVAPIVTHAAAPNPPSNLHAKALGVNAFRLEWDDNSSDEAGWEILASLSGDPTTRYDLEPSPNSTSYLVITGEIPGQDLDFQVRAYKGTEPNLEFSKKTSVATATAFGNITFKAPINLVATASSDGTVNLKWDDRSTSELRYSIEAKTGGGDWAELGGVPPDTEFNIPVGGLTPETTYSFRVRAGKGNPLVYTDYSNVSQATTLAFKAPTDLVVKAGADGGFTFNWKDRSTAEAGFELQSQSGLDPYGSLGNTGPNLQKITVPGFSFNTTYHFRIRGFRVVDSTTVYSDFTNVVIVKSTAMQKPTGLALANVGEGSVEVTWNDESDRESNYEIAVRKKGTSEFSSSYVGKDLEKFTLTKLAPGTTYEIKVRAFDLLSSASSAFTPVQEIVTKDGIAGDLNPPIFRKTSFFNQLVISRVSKLTSLTVTGLPNGLVFSPTERTISGITLAEGVRNVKIKAVFEDSSVVNKTMVLRIIRPPSPPLKIAGFEAVNVAASSSTIVPLNGKFADPDTADAVRFVTNAGTYDIILYTDATPATVANFLDYVQAGRFANLFFHRAVNDPGNNLVIAQAGGYRHTVTDGYTRVPKFPTVMNEPGISNRRGTVAMAKVEGFPNSATSEFFVNIDNGNASNLDEQNEGFTVFGRIAEGGMSVFDDINAMPRKDYSITIGAAAQALKDVPTVTENASATLDPALLVKVSEASRKPVLSYEVVSRNNAVATANVSSGNVVVTGVASGTTRIQVKATDLDGNTVSQDIPVTVP